MAFVPQLVADSANGAVAALVIDEPLPPRRIALAWRSDRAVHAAHDVFVRQATKVSGELGLHA